MGFALQSYFQNLLADNEVSSDIPEERLIHIVDDNARVRKVAPVLKQQDEEDHDLISDVSSSCYNEEDELASFFADEISLGSSISSNRWDSMPSSRVSPTSVAPKFVKSEQTPKAPARSLSQSMRSTVVNRHSSSGFDKGIKHEKQEMSLSSLYCYKMKNNPSFNNDKNCSDVRKKQLKSLILQGPRQPRRRTSFDRTNLLGMIESFD